MESCQKPLILRERKREGKRRRERGLSCSSLHISAPCKLSSPPFFQIRGWRGATVGSLPIREGAVGHNTPSSTDREMDSHKSSILAREELRTESRMSITSLWNFAILKKKTGDNLLEHHKIKSLSDTQAGCHLNNDSSVLRIGHF